MSELYSTEKKTITAAQVMADLTGVTQYVFGIRCIEEDGYSWLEYEITEDKSEYIDVRYSELLATVLPSSKQQTDEEMNK
jgi:hypothetical protein|tara:strand:+ start:1639 stop:1878 length:240 start_codon:yes stop_codon:yes gene_type:complete